jgi:hypothetical protein
MDMAFLDGNLAKFLDITKDSNRTKVEVVARLPNSNKAKLFPKNNT